MSGRFEGKRVLVTGAASGVGADLADAFRQEGARVFATDVTPADGVHVADLTDATARDAMVATALADLGGLDVLCNVAGVQKFHAIEDLTDAAVQLHLQVNTVAPIMLVKACVAALKESRGNVVTISSVSALMGQPYNAAYNASKGGVALAMRALAAELAPHHVRVNCVAPGAINTPLIAHSMDDMAADTNWDAVMSRSTSLMPGIASPRDISDAVLFLASDAAQSITAASLTVDRGTIF